MMILGLALFAIGYAVAYWAMTILWDAYTQTTSPMNPPPLAVCLAIPGSGTGTTTPTSPNGGNAPTPGLLPQAGQ